MRVAEVSAQLANANAQIESLRRQLQAAAEPVTEDNIEPRVRKILESARTEAARLRSEADAYALAVGRSADEAAERIRTSARVEAAEVLAEKAGFDEDGQVVDPRQAGDTLRTAHRSMQDAGETLRRAHQDFREAFRDYRQAKRDK